MDVAVDRTTDAEMTAVVLSSYCFCYADAVEMVSADSYLIRSIYFFKKLPFLRQLIFCMNPYLFLVF